MEYSDIIYSLANKLPRSEEYNLKSQIIRSATSVSLNIAEGSIGQTKPEFIRFLNMAIRSNVEVIACLHLMKRRSLVNDSVFREAYDFGEKLFAKTNALKKSLK